MPKNKLTNIVLVVFILLSGFGREYIMVNINWVIQHLSLGAPNYSQSFFRPLINWSLADLRTLKWFLTVLFTFYFFGLTYVLIKSLYPKNRVFHKLTLAVYALMVLVSGVVFVFGSLTGYSNELYPTVRTLMGVAQSFIPMMVLYLLFKFIPNKNDYPKKG